MSLLKKIYALKFIIEKLEVMEKFYILHWIIWRKTARKALYRNFKFPFNITLNGKKTENTI